MAGSSDDCPACEARFPTDATLVFDFYSPNDLSDELNLKMTLPQHEISTYLDVARTAFVKRYWPRKKPTTSGVPRRSPIQVLTRLNPA